MPFIRTLLQALHYGSQARFRCTGYFVYPFLKMSGEQRFSIGLVCTFLKVYASIFDFLQ